MAEYGANFNMALTRNEDGLYNIGLNIADNNGLKVSQEYCGTDLNKISSTMMTEVTKSVARQKLANKAKAEEAQEEPETVTSGDLVEKIEEQEEYIAMLEEYVDELETLVNIYENPVEEEEAEEERPSQLRASDLFADMLLDKDGCYTSLKKFLDIL